jgi:DNA-binding IclR family transcriptional regulator
MARLPHATSDELAREAGLDERYVREWLGAMVKARIVEYEPRGGRYRLPAAYAALLTRAATPNNFRARETSAFAPFVRPTTQSDPRRHDRGRIVS